MVSHSNGTTLHNNRVSKITVAQHSFRQMVAFGLPKARSRIAHFQHSLCQMVAFGLHISVPLFTREELCRLCAHLVPTLCPSCAELKDLDLRHSDSHMSRAVPKHPADFKAFEEPCRFNISGETKYRDQRFNICRFITLCMSHAEILSYW